MSLIKPLGLSKLCLKNKGVVYTIIRNHWNKDFKPGPFPKTPEERAAAAKKYELLPSEYEPYPDDGTGLGDYPNLPLVSADSKDPFYPWDFPEFKRNFNEPFHVDADMYGQDRYDISARHRVSGRMQLAQFLGVMFSLYGLYYICDEFRGFLATAEKQYPYKGDKHYTFESN